MKDMVNINWNGLENIEHLLTVPLVGTQSQEYYVPLSPSLYSKLSHCGLMSKEKIRVNPLSLSMEKCFAALIALTPKRHYAYDTERGLVLSQKPTETNNDEINIVRQMLDIINVKGSIITIDALHCQCKTLEKIAAKNAHVVIQVKKNQPKLRDVVVSQFQTVFDAKKEKVVTEVTQTLHGRKEEQIVFQLKAKLPQELAEKWTTIRSIIAVESHRTINGKGTVDTSYYIRSLSPNHKLLGHYIRQHWRIENSQHYALDVVFKEDSSRICLEGAVENIALFRRFVMNTLKQCECGAPS